MPKHFCDCGKELYCNCIPCEDCGGNEEMCTCGKWRFQTIQAFQCHYEIY